MDVLTGMPGTRITENALLEHEAGAEAVAVPAPGAVRLAASKARAVPLASRATLAPYKRLRRLEFGVLPKTVSGKIRRIELREATAAGSDAEYREEDFR